MRFKQFMEGARRLVYHGTTSVAWAAIQDRGIIPQDNPNSMFRGNMSTIHGYTDKNIYLTFELEKARYYAEEQAEHQGSTPIILAVDPSLLDLKLCQPDDDTLLVMLADQCDTDEDDVADRLNSGGDDEVNTKALQACVKEWQKKFNFKDEFANEFAYAGSIQANQLQVIK